MAVESVLRVTGVCLLGLTSVIVAEIVFWRLYLCSENTEALGRRATNTSNMMKKARAKIATMKDDKKKAKELKSLSVLEMEYRKMAIFPKTLELKRQGLVMACVFCTVVAFIDLHGPPVANLPFTAVFPLKKVTHMGLDGDDYTELGSMGLLLMFVTVSSAMVRNAFNFNLPQSLITAARESTYAYTESFMEGNSS